MDEAARDAFPEAREKDHTLTPSRARISYRKKVTLLATLNLILFLFVMLAGELGFRLLWHPKYRLRCDRWDVGCGMTAAGRKYWPNSTYRIESPEFRVRFRTNSLGYRARPDSVNSDRPYRIAFVGDSFTEGMQVEYQNTFCAQIERGLSEMWPDREVVCENFGVAATGLFDYWHRISHDVLNSNSPDALVLCLYPGNDFIGEFPADGFDPDGKPRGTYFTEPTWARHSLTWLNLNSQLARYLQERVYRAWQRLEPPYEAPKHWWTNPVLTSDNGDAPVIRRARALLQTIDEECRRRGTRLCVIVIGPVTTYRVYNGQSPLTRILADWKIEAPVIDLAIEALAVPNFRHLLFPRDGHLNEAGHAFVAGAALPRLRTVLDAPVLTTAVVR